jgi:HEAT repeat protein
LIASGNSNNRVLIPKIKKYLSHDEAIVRGAAVWSFSRLENRKKNEILNKIKQKEKNKYVLFELNSVT